MPTKTDQASTPLVCTPRRLPIGLVVDAADIACRINPMNHAPTERLARVMPGFAPTKARIAVLTTKYWRTDGVHLTVGFLDNPEPALRRRIIQHMNAWDKTARVKFVETKGQAQVRIARDSGRDGGYWSYLGTDILSIKPGDPTMNLEAFTMDTPESEFRRVVRHETGHTLGCPHEHMRRTLVRKIDPAKAIAYYGRTQGWNPDEVRAQVLTPIEERSLLGSENPDPNSIMCYEVPGEITKDGKTIVGGADIDSLDYKFIGSIYPKQNRKALRLPRATRFHATRRAPTRQAARRR